MFPASKSNTTDPDDAITSLNHNVEAVFIEATTQVALPSYDKRGHYRLVGAQWMDKPGFFDSTSRCRTTRPARIACRPSRTRRESTARSPWALRHSRATSRRTAPTAPTRSSRARTACRAPRWSRSRRRRDVQQLLHLPQHAGDQRERRPLPAADGRRQAAQPRLAERQPRDLELLSRRLRQQRASPDGSGQKQAVCN